MSVPYTLGAQPGQRGPNGYVQMPGGYTDAIAQAPGGAPPVPSSIGMPTPMQGMPGPQQVPPGSSPQQQPWSGVPQLAQQPNPNPMPPQGWPGQGGAPFAPQQATGLPPQMQGQGPQQQWGQQPGFAAPQVGGPPALVPQWGAPGNGQGTNLEQTLSGPGVPPELQGRSMRELLAIHDGLRRIHLQQIAGGGPPSSAPSQAPQQASPAAPTGGQQGQQQSGWDWRNPEQSVARVTEQVLNRAIDEKLGPMLAPLQHQAAYTSINTARQNAVQQFGPQLFAQLEPLIMQSLQGIDPRALSNPQTWIVAADRALGQATRAGQLQNGGPRPGQPGVFPAQAVPPGQQPLPNLGTFFSEQPNQGGPGVPVAQLTPQQMWYADAMQIPHAVYAAWAGGGR